MLFTVACTKWVRYRARMSELGAVEPSTLDNQARIAVMLGEAVFSNLALEDLRKSDLDLWAAERLQTHAPVTVRGETNVLRQILNWCVDESYLLQRPRMPTVQVPNVETKLPDDDAFLWALKSVPEHHRHALEFMMLTGLSPHEAERLQVRDLVVVDGSSGGIGVGQRTDFKVKTPNRRRIVPLNERARRLWDILTMGKRPLETALPKAGTMQKALVRARAIDAAAPKDAHRITPKLMRQWFASQVAGGSPEHVLQRLMGHAPGSKITRRHYVRSNDEQMAGAVQGLRA